MIRGEGGELFVDYYLELAKDDCRFNYKSQAHLNT